MKIVAVIPCYNEAEFIVDVVEKTKKYVDMVIVMDDHSKDNTVELAKKAGAEVVINYRNNKGAGGNTNLGIKTALYYYADVVVTLDGDGQHNPDEIPLILKPILDGESDCVIGSRFTNWQKTPLYRRLGISTITYVFNLGKKQQTSDSQSGFRAFRKEVFDKVEITEKDFGFSVESLVKIRADNFRICDVPINVIYHDDFKLNSSMNPIKHGLQVLLKVIYWRLRVELCKR